MLTHEEQMDLCGLRWHWDTAYSIGLDDGIWTAVPHLDPAVLITADTADELRAMIRADYTQRTAKPAPLTREQVGT